MFGRAISNRSRGPLPRTMFGAGQLRAFTARWRVAIDPRPRTGPRGPRCHRTHRRASCSNPRGLRGPASLESILSEVGPDLAPGKIRVRGGRHGLGKRPFVVFEERTILCYVNRLSSWNGWYKSGTIRNVWTISRPHGCSPGFLSGWRRGFQAFEFLSSTGLPKTCLAAWSADFSTPPVTHHSSFLHCEDAGS